MHAISSYPGNRHRPPATNTQTHRQDRLQYTAPLASAQCNDTMSLCGHENSGNSSWRDETSYFTFYFYFLIILCCITRLSYPSTNR